MEFSSLVDLNVSTMVMPLIVLWLIYLWRKRNNAGVDVVKNLPPGPKKLPIIGNVHLISDPHFRSFRDLARQYGPLIHLKIGAADTIVVSSPELACQVLKEKDPAFANRPGSIALQVCWYDYLDFVFCPYGDYWRQMRKICISEVLGPKSVRSFAPIRRDEVSHLVESLRLSAAAGSPVNLTDKLYMTNSYITCRASFGKVSKDNSSMIKIVQDTLTMGAGFSIADMFPSSAVAAMFGWVVKLRLLKNRRKLDVVLDDIVRRHETSPTGSNGEFGNEDLVDVLLRVKEAGLMKVPFDNDNIKAILLDMFGTSTDTSTSTVVWAMTELLRNPRVMEKAQDEVRKVVNSGDSTTIIEEEVIPNLNYLKLVIMETLRMHPTVAVIPRASRETCEIGGYTIPKNVKVLVNVWSIHRDPKYWSDPETFQPERFQNQNSFDFTGNNDFRFLPFGSGRRICPGITYGTTSVTLFLAQLLYSFNWKLPNGVDAQDLDMMETTALTTPRKQDLIVVPTPYQPLTL